MANTMSNSSGGNSYGILTVVTTGTGTTVTCTFPASSSFTGFADEFSDVGGSPTQDGSTTYNSGTGTALATNTFTPSFANELILTSAFAGGGPPTTLTSGGTWVSETYGAGADYVTFAYNIPSSTAGQQATWSIGASQTWNAGIAGFK
jgi:hypothetical protein